MSAGASTGVVLRPLIWSMAGKERETESVSADATDRPGAPPETETAEPAAGQPLAPRCNHIGS
jgi:hypothetical protein